MGRSPAMQQVYKAIGRVAPTDATVLIRGESGTGKELVARAVYQHSLRSEAPLMVVNCAAIPETLLESELFGYEPGAFTGATTRRIGKFQQAHGGTIFLDEIGDIPLMVQAKILRLLQEQTFERLGSNETIQVNVRVLCATNRNLEEAIAQRTFREDLYYRLNVVALHLPPLREARRHPAAGRLLLEPVCTRPQRGETAPFPASPRCPGGLLMAGQRARVGTCGPAANDLHRWIYHSSQRLVRGHTEQRTANDSGDGGPLERRAIHRLCRRVLGLLPRRPGSRSTPGKNGQVADRRGPAAVQRQPDVRRPALGAVATNLARKDAEIRLAWVRRKMK